MSQPAGMCRNSKKRHAVNRRGDNITSLLTDIGVRGKKPGCRCFSKLEVPVQRRCDMEVWRRVT